MSFSVICHSFPSSCPVAYHYISSHYVPHCTTSHRILSRLISSRRVLSHPIPSHAIPPSYPVPCNPTFISRPMQSHLHIPSHAIPPSYPVPANTLNPARRLIFREDWVALLGCGHGLAVRKRGRPNPTKPYQTKPHGNQPWTPTNFFILHGWDWSGLVSHTGQ